MQPQQIQGFSSVVFQAKSNMSVKSTSGNSFEQFLQNCKTSEQTKETVQKTETDTIKAPVKKSEAENKQEIDQPKVQSSDMSTTKEMKQSTEVEPLDKELAEGMQDSIFVKQLRAMENGKRFFNI